MTHSATFPSTLIHAARDGGDVLEPKKLLDTLTALADPLALLTVPDASERLFAALWLDLGFLGQPWLGTHPPSESVISKWAALLRWLLRELREWRNDRDVRRTTLIACFLVAHASHGTAEFWGEICDAVGDNPELAAALKRSISSLKVNFTLGTSRDRPIYESEIVEQLTRGEEQGDWVAIAQSWQRVRMGFHDRNFYVTQAIRYLAQAQISSLVEALADLRQTTATMLVADALTIDQRLQVALASSNLHIQFACLYRALSDMGLPESWTSGDDALLEHLLVKVALDVPRWHAWMRVFNAHPSRYPRMRKALGRALARVPKQAIQAYVDSIVLFPAPLSLRGSRASVAESLRAFRESATSERRRELWETAHNRWYAWHFADGDPHVHITGINVSELDFAVVGFACECMDESARSAAMEEVLRSMETLEHQWHASASELQAGWDRLLSRLQPYAHASKVASNGEDWLQQTQGYLPFDTTKHRYLAAKYRMSLSLQSSAS